MKKLNLESITAGLDVVKDLIEQNNNGILLMVGGGFMYFAERVLGFIGITV